MNRFRRERQITVGTKVDYRDPRARAAGGCTPWKQPLIEPLVVVAVDGNDLKIWVFNPTISTKKNNAPKKGHHLYYNYFDKFRSYMSYEHPWFSVLRTKPLIYH